MEIRPIEPRRRAGARRASSRASPRATARSSRRTSTDPACRGAWARPAPRARSRSRTARSSAPSRSCRCTAGRATSARSGSSSTPTTAGDGIGRALARHAVLDALELGLAKLVVEVIADQTALIGMFRALGFEPEALLTDHVRDRSGELRDLMVLAHTVEEQFAAMATAGIADQL